MLQLWGSYESYALRFQNDVEFVYILTLEMNKEEGLQICYKFPFYKWVNWGTKKFTCLFFQEQQQKKNKLKKELGLE